MIRLILDEAAAGFEQDIRELVGEFYPGEDFEIRANGKVWLSNASQEEKNALKAARESGTATAVNKKSTKNSAKMTGFLTPEGAPDGSITRTIEVKGEMLSLTGKRKRINPSLRVHSMTGFRRKQAKRCRGVILPASGRYHW